MIPQLKKEAVKSQLQKQLLQPGDKIWRISSLNAMHDSDSKLRLRPKPTSEKKLRAIETVYKSRSLFHLFQNFIEQIEEVAGEKSTRTIVHKYQDLTQEQKRELSKQKNKKRFRKLFKVRFYQIMFLSSALVFYIMIGRKYYPKPVFRSVPYKQALTYLENNSKVQSMLPNQGMTVLNCEGRINQFSSKLRFSMLVPSKQGLMKVFVQSELKNKQWRIRKMSLLTEQNAVGLLDI